MEFSVEKYISNFVENQFPQFYQEDGPTFILFMKAYYEWLEEQGNPIGEARRLFDHRDIDNTTEEFLQQFQKKYLYGIPFDIISNKRFLLKHILDVYRSKGTIYCYKLLFRLIYDEDVDIYLPGTDVMRVSDGNWQQPKYLEVTKNDVMKDWVGLTIVGTTSNTFAVVENYIQQRYNNDIINLVYITNVLPNGGEFIIGEKIVRYDFLGNTEINYQAPVVLGSMNTLDITIGGQDFNVGDVLKLVYKDPITNDIISYGKEGLIRVSEVFRQVGALTIRVQSSGFGFTANSLTFLYNDTYDKTGAGGSFQIRNLYSKRYVLYNDDVIYDFKDVVLNDPDFGFEKNPASDINFNLEDALTYKGETFGRILNLRNIKIGNNYTKPAITFTRSVITSNPLPGTISYSSDALEVQELVYTGTATNYNNTDIITVENLRANVDIKDTRGSIDPGETHDIILDSNGAIYQFSANSLGFSNTTNVIYIYQADDYFAKGDKVYYQVPTGNTALKGLTGNNYYWINFVNTTSIALAANALGTNATLSLTTNTTGGNLTFTVTDPGSNFIDLSPNVVVNAFGGGPSGGSGAVFDVGFAYYVTGVGTVFTDVFNSNSVIYFQANSSDSNTVEYQVVKEVITDTKLYLYGNTKYNSTDSAQYKVALTTIPANFATYDTLMYSANGSINGENEKITAIPSSGNNAIKSVSRLDSGIGYVEGEEVTAFLYNAVSDAITIVDGGTGYANNEKIVFAGGDPGTIATGYVSTNSTGGIIDVTVLNGGSGYRQPPEVLVQTRNGTGAYLTAELTEFNTLVEVTGLVNKTGIGQGKGFWTSTRSFLDSDKYIQDSYYYQDYSYEIRVARNLAKYKDILNDTFHSAGSELFGKYAYKDLNESIIKILYDETQANTDPVTLYTLVSGDFITSDEDDLTVDSYVYDYYEYVNIPTVSVDSATINVDSISQLSDYIVISVDRDLNSNGDIYVHLTADSNSRFVTSDIIAY